MDTTRREFIHKALLASAGVAMTVPSLTRSVSASESTSLHKIPFADSELTVLSDGHMSLPVRFVLPDSIGEQQINEFLSANNMDASEFTPVCNVTLWRTEDRLIIFDVGAGANFMPTAGKLLESLESAQIDPADVTDVVFTHAHPDHLWGLLDDFDELLFPNASYYMDHREWDFWRAADTLDKMPDPRKTFVVGAQNRFPYIEDRIRLFKSGDEVLPGIEAVDTSGHTPGHTSFALHHEGQSVMLLGDAITNANLSFKKPGWPSGSDQDQEQGRVTRLALLDRLATDRHRIIGFHLPWPGVGQVETEGDHYRFVVDV